MSAWKDISTAPKDGTDVLLCYSSYTYYDDRRIQIGFYHDEVTKINGKVVSRNKGWRSRTVPNGSGPQPLLWQLLPKPDDAKGK